ncbi:uncharacterized protein [Periplaneta americana]|uniref:uncharacterized protein n=1 Tax=Periplaneta americana TaxID=6978 RepID=UPI0037E99E41
MMTPSLESLILYFIASCTIFFVALYLYSTRNFNIWKKRGIPYLKPIPFVGTLLDLVLLKLGIGHFLQRIYNEHGDKPYVGMFSFDQPSLLIRDLNLVKSILVKDSQNFINRMPDINVDLDPLFAYTIFTLKDLRWRHVRVNLTPVFTSGKMKKMFYLVENCGRELRHHLDRATANGDVVSVKDTMARYTTDVIASCAFGIESNSLKNPEAEFRRYLRRIFEFSFRKGLASVTAFFSPAVQNFFKLYILDGETTDFIRKTVWSTVEYREKHGVVRKDFLDCMIELRNKGRSEVSNGSVSENDSNIKIEGDLFVAQAFAFLAAGFETSSTTMVFALYELALQPDLQHRLRTEISLVLSQHQGQLTYEAIQQMTYLDMVVSETLRKYPILPFLDRKCLKDYELPSPSGKGTVTLPAGTGVFIPIMAIQNDPKYFPDPEIFDPERFTEEKKKRRPSYTYLPFGEGPRICLGMRFALISTKTGLIHVLSHYEVAPCKDTPVPLVFDNKSFLLAPRDELPLSFTRRRSDVTSGIAMNFESLAMYLAIVFVFVFAASYFYFTRHFNFWKNLGFPYEKPIPFAGNMRDLVLQRCCLGEALRLLYARHWDKPYVGFFSFDQPNLLVRDLNLVKRILVSDAQYFSDRILAIEENCDPIFGKSLPNLKGKRWRHVRTHLTPAFTSAKIKKMLYLVDDCSRELVHCLDRETGGGEVVQVKEVMARYTTDVIATCAFGIESNSLKYPNAEFRTYLRRIFDYSLRKGLFSVTAFSAPALQNLLKLRMVDEETSEFLRKATWSTVAHRKDLVRSPYFHFFREKNGLFRNDFLDCLMELRNKGKNDVKDETKTGNISASNNQFVSFASYYIFIHARPVFCYAEIEGDDFVAQAFIFLVAGFETSSTTMSYTLYELALQPDLQHRLRTEIRSVLDQHKGSVTYEAIQQMTYLHMVVSETLRKYPVLPFLDRTCLRDYSVPDASGKGTLTLPAGTGVFIPLFGIHNDPKYYPDPERFDPERFTEENKKSLPSYTYMPFGEGPRICIGMRFGLMSTKCGLIHVLSRYEVATCKDTPKSLVFDCKAFLLSTLGELPLRFKRATI